MAGVTWRGSHGAPASPARWPHRAGVAARRAPQAWHARCGWAAPRRTLAPLGSPPSWRPAQADDRVEG
eukprot:2551206-Prymnesium_polylepis.1